MSSLNFFSESEELFNIRKNEIDLFLNMLNAKKDENEEDRKIHFMMRSNVYLMLYNMVEAVISNIFKELYAFLSNLNLNFDVFDECFQRMLVNKLRSLTNSNVSELNKKSEIIIFQHQILKVCFAWTEKEKKKLFSGNIDAQLLRERYEDYGVKLEIHEDCQKGRDLLDIKDKRNLLAHGGSSFVDVGKTISASELLNIKQRVDLYISEILRISDEYLTKKEFIASSPA